MINDQKTNPVGKIKFADEKLNQLAVDIIDKTEKYEKEDLEYNLLKGGDYKVNKHKS